MLRFGISIHPCVYVLGCVIGSLRDECLTGVSKPLYVYDEGVELLHVTHTVYIRRC